MYRRPFLVLPGGDCVPLEGDYRIEPLRGEWYVLGHHSVFRFDTEEEALARLAHLRGDASPHAVAAFVLELADEPEAGDGHDGRVARPGDGPELGALDRPDARSVELAVLAPVDLFGEADLH
ncbi:MAG: hypothetical protein IPK00_10005 [Deltaproteobacteria bacterium]|nr:hypothetical protein [Deltaproteobacteria bacterium]